MSLRLAYMTGEYPRATDTFIQREVAALRAVGVHVETLSVRRPSDKENVGPETQAERAVTKYLLPACPWDLFKTHTKLLAGSPRRYLSALRTALFVRPAGLKPFLWQLAYFAEAGLVARTMREHQLSHLHNHFSNSSCSVAMLASEMGGFTFSFTMHGPSEFFEPKYWRVDEKIRRALFVCCISHFCRSQAMVFAPQEKWPNLHVVHCGVDPSQFTLTSHEGRSRRLLFVGRLAAVKGLPILLDALAQLNRDARNGETPHLMAARDVSDRGRIEEQAGDIKGEAPHLVPGLVLTVAGDGPDRAKLEQQSIELGLAGNVRFVGYQSQAQVRQLLGATDVFVMSSFAEGVPVVLMEAMAAGVPVVATRIAGVPELVEEGVSGFLVPPGDAWSLSERVRTLLEDPALRQRFGAAGRAEVEREFNLATESQRLVQILTEALEGRTAAVRPAVEVRANSASNPQLQAALT